MAYYLGEILWIAGNNPQLPSSMIPCDGRLLPVAGYAPLYELIGNTYGGGGSSFAVPDLRGRVVIGFGAAPYGGPTYTLGQSGGEEAVALTDSSIPSHTHAAQGVATPGTSATGGGQMPAEPSMSTGAAGTAIYGGTGAQVSLAASAVNLSTGAGAPHANLQPFVVLQPYIVADGVWPSPSATDRTNPAPGSWNSWTPIPVPPSYAGEVRMMTTDIVPSGWLLCDGSSYQITAFPELFVTVGSRFTPNPAGTTFNVPDLRGVAIMGNGAGSNLTPRRIGERGGSEQVTLTSANETPHRHPFYALNGTATQTEPGGFFGANAGGLYALSSLPSAPMAPNAVLPNAPLNTSIAPHDNMMPSLPIQFIIATATQQGTGGAGTDAFIGEIRSLAHNKLPGAYQTCSGQPLSVGMYQQLASIMGYTYGVARTPPSTMLAPMFNGTTPIGAGNGNGLTPRALGVGTGEAGVMLTIQQYPPHTHTANVVTTSTVGQLVAQPGNTVVVARTKNQRDFAAYSQAAQLSSMGTVLGSNSNGGPHDNMQPFLALNICICTTRAKTQ